MLWSNHFRCDIPHIDAQHMALFEYMERMGNTHGDISRTPKTLDLLLQYTREHFADEQSLHAQVQYPQALEHSRQHQAFLQKMLKIRNDYDISGFKFSIMKEINHTGVNWLRNHILSADKEFAAFFGKLPEHRKTGIRLARCPWIPEEIQQFLYRAPEESGEGGAVIAWRSPARVFGR